MSQSNMLLQYSSITMKHLYGIWIAYLVFSQVGVNATIDVYNIINRLVNSFSNEDATISDTAISGYIEYAHPPNACTHIAIPKFKPTNTKKNIVLINGTSECHFMTKIKYAKEVGYEAAVLFDPFPGPFKYSNITFPFPWSEINISVVLVSFEDGINIRKNYLYPQSNDWKNVYLIIYPTIWRLYWIYFGLGALGLVILVFVCGVSVIVFQEIWKKYRNRFGNQNQVDNNAERVVERTFRIIEIEVNLENALNNLKRQHPSVVFSKGDPFDVCTICLQNYQVDERLRVLSCSHAYHADCIDRWWLHKLTCPLCEDNLKNSSEQSLCNASESTPLLTFTHDEYSSTRTGNNGGLSSSLSATTNNPLRSAGESSNILVGAQGSVNSVHQYESGNEDTQTLIV